jgi:hypothetical protein
LSAGGRVTGPRRVEHSGSGRFQDNDKPMDVSEIRRRVRTAIESARKTTQERRARTDQAARDYEVFLRDVAVPVFQVFGSALVAEGHRFKVYTPAESVRLVSDSSQDDFVEIVLDSSVDPPSPIARTNRSRGRKGLTSERPVREKAAIAELTEEDVLALLLEEIVPFIER